MMILNKDEVEFAQAALTELSTRQPLATIFCDVVSVKVKTLIELIEQDKKCLALAIQGKSMHDGPGSFDVAAAVSKYFDLGDLLEKYLKSWIEH